MSGLLTFIIIWASIGWICGGLILWMDYIQYKSITLKEVFLGVVVLSGLLGWCTIIVLIKDFFVRYEDEISKFGARSLLQRKKKEEED